MHSLRDHLFVIPLPWNEIADVFLLGGYVAGEVTAYGTLLTTVLCSAKTVTALIIGIAFFYFHC